MTLLSYSLTLRRDLDALRPQLREEDADFADFWEKALEESGDDLNVADAAGAGVGRPARQGINEAGAQERAERI